MEILESLGEVEVGYVRMMIVNEKDMKRHRDKCMDQGRYGEPYMEKRDMYRDRNK